MGGTHDLESYRSSSFQQWYFDGTSLPGKVPAETKNHIALYGADSQLAVFIILYLAISSHGVINHADAPFSQSK